MKLMRYQPLLRKLIATPLSIFVLSVPNIAFSEEGSKSHQEQIEIDENIKHDDIQGAIQLTAEVIMHVCIKTIETQSKLGTMMLTERHPFSITLEKHTDNSSMQPAIYEYMDEPMAFLYHGIYMDYEAVSFGKDDNKSGSNVWKQIPENAKFYVKDGSNITFYGFGVMLNEKYSKNVKGVEFVSGKINTTSSVQNLEFSDKSTCVVRLEDPANPDGQIERTYQYVNSQWTLKE
jgi:hypothetical protein